MNDYLLLMRGGDARMAEQTEAQRAEHMQKWGAYMGGLTESGNLTGGQPLTQDARLVTANNVSEEMVLSDKKETIGGYLMVKANDYNHAVEIAQECPIFEYEGNIEIREIMEM